MSFQALVWSICAHLFVLVRCPSAISIGWEIHSSHGDEAEGSQYLLNTNIPYSSIFSAFCSVSLDSQTSRRGYYRWCLQFLTSYSLLISRQWLLLWPLHLGPSCQGQQHHPYCQSQWMCFHLHLTFLNCQYATPSFWGSFLFWVYDFPGAWCSLFISDCSVVGFPRTLSRDLLLFVL